MLFEIDAATKQYVKRLSQGVAGLSGALADLETWMAKEAADEVVAGIQLQVFKVQPLAASTVAYKRRHQLDPRVFIATREYVDSIKARGREVEADEQLASWLEYGTKRMPARPHWAPALKAVKKSSMQKLAEELKRVLASG